MGNQSLFRAIICVLVPATAVFAAPPDGKGGGNGGGGGGGGKDKEAPVVSITNPSNGATVAGTITISADATDNVGVTAVSYSIDGGSAVAMSNTTGSTWEGAWDTTTVTDGGHTISVTAEDSKGNASSDSVSVTTDNGLGPVFPDSMGAIGDSITVAVFADGSLGGLADGQPEHSWATGHESGDGVDSHYERILAQHAAINGNNFNNAVSGARMDDFTTQANNTIPQAPEYVVVFLGHNDLCRSNISDIPSDAEFESHFRSGLDTLIAGLPGTNIVVLEIIDVAQLYECCSSNFGCVFSWALYGICESVTQGSSSDRQFVRQRTLAFNNILRNVCAEKGVLFEDDIYEQTFVRSDLSSTDCFHPSLQGQQKISNASYDESRF